MPAYSDAVLADSPLGYYRFEETSGLTYADSSGNSNDITTSVDTDVVGSGVHFWSTASRISALSVECPAVFAGIEDFTFETLFRADTPDRYVLAESVASGANSGVLIEVSEDAGAPGDYLLKFGLGGSGWDIEDDDATEHAFVYSDEIGSELFDGQWHHIVCTWDGTNSAPWAASELTIYIDGVDRTDSGTGADNSFLVGVAPISFENSLYICGPATGANDEEASFDELAVYSSTLGSTAVLDHYNCISAVETVEELSEAFDLLPYTAGLLETIEEIDSLGSLSIEFPALLIEGVSEVLLDSTTSDALSGREILDDEGTTTLSLDGTTLETGEPNVAGYTGTRWYELPVNLQNTLKMRVILSSPTSTGKVSVYKQPSLDDYEDSDDLSEDDTDVIFEGEPSLSELVLVQTAAADQVFTLDQEYGSSYFLQVGLLTGDGDDFTLTWEDADPLEGGTFEWPVEAGGPAGTRILNTKNAWLQSGEPDAASITETRSVWMAWTAPVTASNPTLFTISRGMGAPFGAGVYTGSAVGSLTPVTTGYSSDGSNLTLSIVPSSGVTYYVRVATTEQNAGFRINYAAPVTDVSSAEPVQHLVVTVHAGVAGGTWNGVTYAPNEKITELPNRTGCQFQEALNVPGSGSLSIMQSDLMLRAYNPDDWPLETSGAWTPAQATYDQDPFQLLQFGNFIKFWMGGDCVSGFIIRARDITVLGQGEEAERILTVSGPTMHYLLNDFIVMHDNYPEHRNEETRSFTWASIVGPGDTWAEGGWFDTSANFAVNTRSWNHPVNADKMTNPPGYTKKQSQPAKQRPKYGLLRAKKPRWPDTKARWMWIHQNKNKNQNTNFPPAGYKIEGTHYYRAKTFNITGGGGRYRFSVHSDTYYEVWLDGKRFLAGNGNETFKKFKSKTTYLEKTTPERAHSLAVYVEDRGSGKKKVKDYDHNDAFIMTVQQLNKKGKVKKTILRSNAASWYVWHGPEPPSWSRAMVLATLIREAKARGNDSANALTLRSDFGQKSEEGDYWPDNKKLSIALEIGMTVLDVQAGFSESNVFDVRVDPDTLEVRAWQGSVNGDYPQGRNRSNNIALVPGQNLINWSVSELDEIKTQVLVRYKGGYVDAVVGPDSPNYKGYLEKYGRREAFLEQGGLTSKRDARIKGQSVLSQLAVSAAVSGSEEIVGHFNESYSGSIVPVKGSVPFLDFHVGDTIAAPGSNGFLRSHRVLSLTCTEDENGVLTFDPELEGV